MAEIVKTRDFLKQLTSQYNEELATAKEKGRLVAWSSALFPQEFLAAMDVLVAFPENHTAMVAAKGQALPFIDYAEKMGFTSDVCSYVRVNVAEAMMINNDCPDAGEDLKAAFSKIVPLPKPDFLVTATNSCFALPKWYEWLAEYFDIPLFILEVPFNLEIEPPAESVEYVKNQLLDFIPFLEKVCGRPFDYKEFAKCNEITRKNYALWNKTTKYSEMSPSPIDGFSIFNQLALIGMQRCRETTTQYYELLHEELDTAVAEGRSLYKGKQRHRIMWEGIACWPHLRYTASYLQDKDIIFVTSRYYKSWCWEYDLLDIEGLARATCKILSGCNLECNLDVRRNLLKEGNVEGIICHANKSCRIFALTQKTMINQLNDETSIPCISFDGDQANPGDFSAAQYETRIDALVENMDAAKQAGGAR